MKTALRTILLGLALGGFLADAGLAQLNYQKVTNRDEVVVNVTIFNALAPGKLNWNETYVTEWTDTQGVSHKVTTPKRVGESTGNHAWRHGAYVKTAKKGTMVAALTTGGAGTSGTLPEGGNAPLFSTSWTDNDGLEHTVNTDPKTEEEDPVVTAMRHAERVAALKTVFPPK